MACADALSRLCAVAPALPPDTEYPATRPVTAIPSISVALASTTGGMTTTFSKLPSCTLLHSENIAVVANELNRNRDNELP